MCWHARLKPANYYAIEEAKRQRQSVLDNVDELYNSGSDFTLGPKNASVTSVEFFEYNCGYCKRVFPALMKFVEENDDVRVVFKEFPILSENSRTAASYALALDEQLKFLTYHSKLMSSLGSVNPALLERTLKEIGVDVEAVKSRAADAAISETIDRTQALAGALGINGTPAFVINDEIHPGALSEDRLRELVAEARGPKPKPRIKSIRQAANWGRHKPLGHTPGQICLPTGNHRMTHARAICSGILASRLPYSSARRRNQAPWQRRHPRPCPPRHQPAPAPWLVPQSGEY